MNSKKTKGGFTLFELLVTISVIILMAGILYANIDFGKTTGNLDRGLQAIHSMVRVARSQALVNATSCRLIVNFDETDEENFLRKIGIMVKDDSSAGHWKAVDRGLLLPEGAYVVPRSKISFVSGWPTVPRDRKSVYNKTGATSPDSVFKYEYPLVESVDEATGVDWIAFQFAPNGRLEAVEYVGGGLASNSNQIVIGHARWSEGSLLFTDFENLKAVKFKPNGASFSIEEAALLGAVSSGGGG